MISQRDPKEKPAKREETFREVRNRFDEWPLPPLIKKQVFEKSRKHKGQIIIRKGKARVTW
jgi:hypothetical protein